MSRRGTNARKGLAGRQALRIMIAVLITVLVGVANAGAQASVCPGQPWLGTNGPEICVEITDEGVSGSTVTRRYPGLSGNFNDRVGGWMVDLTFTYTIGDGGMAMTIEGEVWRRDPGSGWLNVRADGGTNTPIHVDDGSLWLDGTATAASGTVVGGGSGVRLPGGDVQFTGFPVVVELTTLGAGAFHGDRDEIPVDAEVVAVTNTTGFHVNEQNDQIEIPSGVGVGDPPPPGDDNQRWWSTNVSSDFLPVESRVAPLTGGPNPTLAMASVYYDTEANHLRVFRVEPPYGPGDVIDDGVLASGFLYGAHKICPLGDGDAILPFIYVTQEGSDVHVANFVDGTWFVDPADATAEDDHHLVNCFTTAHDVYLQTMNFTDNTLDLLRRNQSGEFDLVASLGEAELGGVPESPAFGGPIGRAGDLPSFGSGGSDTVILTIGMEGGQLVVAELTTSTQPTITGLWSAGAASGDTWADIHIEDSTQTAVGSALWQQSGSLWRAHWELGNLNQTIQTTKISDLESGSLIPEFQTLSGAGTGDGTYFALADKCYEIGPGAGDVSVMPSYSFNTFGGPVDFVLVDDPFIQGFAAGPGSQRLGILRQPAPVSELSIPAVARVRGAGAFFTSVMHLFNAGESDLELEMTFTPRQSGGQPKTVSHTLPAGVMQTIEDPLESVFGFGGSAGRVGSVMVDTGSGSVDDLKAQTVVFAELDSGEEYGQYFPAMRAADAISAGRSAYLNTTEDPARNRVNIGLMAVSDGVSFMVTPVDPLGNELAEGRLVNLGLGGNTQINNIHSTFGLGSRADVVVEVKVLRGEGLAYASVLDGNGVYTGTSDPTTILPVLGGSPRVTLLEIGSIQGLNEFSGSASITNYSSWTAAVTADFYQRGDSGVAVSRSLSIPAGDTVGFTDFGADLFGISGDVGTVVLTSTNGARIAATGREFAIFRGNHGEMVGTAGQLISGQTDDDRLTRGETYHFIGLRQGRGGGAVERSHFAVFNPTLGDAEITVRLYDGASGASEGERTWFVGPKTLIQVNNVIRQIDADHDGEEKRIEVEVDRPVFMNAFRVNRWGDPVTISPLTD